jgi:hypothetical protein
MDRFDDITPHVTRLTGAQSRSLISWLASACWPGGGNDRHEPSAAQWLRLWQPIMGSARVHVACACASTGRCGVCN